MGPTELECGRREAAREAATKDWAAHIEHVWDSTCRKTFRRMDWLAYERDIRLVLREFRAGGHSAYAALTVIDDLTAAHTGRGNELETD